jgi:hypothetical protein
MVEHAIRQVEECSCEQEMPDFPLVDLAVCEEILVMHSRSGESMSHL